MTTQTTASAYSTHFLNDEMIRRRNPAVREEQQLKRAMIIIWCGFTVALISMIAMAQ